MYNNHQSYGKREKNVSIVYFSFYVANLSNLSYCSHSSQRETIIFEHSLALSARSLATENIFRQTIRLQLNFPVSGSQLSA